MEDKIQDSECNFCKESLLDVGQKTLYDAFIILKLGTTSENSWFATLSPRTGGDPKKDFSIQLMPVKHLISFSEINKDQELAKNYGLAFAKLSNAAEKIIQKDENEKLKIIPIGVYGKTKHENEHIHIKIFPWRNDIGQPFTVDSSFQKKEIYKNERTGEEFVKMKPVKKKQLSEQRFKKLSDSLISLLK